MLVQSDRLVVDVRREFDQSEIGKFNLTFTRYLVSYRTLQNDIRWQKESKAELERAVKQKTLDRKEALLTNPAKAAFYEKEINNLNKEITKAENKIARFENMIAQLKDYVSHSRLDF